MADDKLEMDDLATLFGTNPRLVADLNALLSWDFDALSRVLDPVLVVPT